MTQVPEEQEEEPAVQETEAPAPHEVPPELAQQEFAYTDHILYAQALYQQPSWVVESVFGPGGLDPAVKTTPATVQTYITQMMQTPDKSFEVEVPQ